MKPSPSTVQIRLNKPQAATHRWIAPGRTVTLPWGRGVGKSWFERLFMYELVARHDGVREGGVRIVLLMPTFKHCVDVHSKLLIAELESSWRFLGGKTDKSRWVTNFPGGSWIQFFGAREADSARGIRCDAVVVDECDDIDASVLQSVVIPWFSEPRSLAMKCIGGTPRRGRQGILYSNYKMGIDGPDREPNYFAEHATYADVPETVKRELVEEARRVTPPEVFAREWECDFDSAEGLVYSLFMEKFHVRPLPARDKAGKLPFHTVLVGCDWGYEDPAVFITIGLTGYGKDTVCWVIDEYYARKVEPTPLKQKAKQLMSRFGGRWFADPSRPDVIAEYAREGIRIEPANNAIEDGILCVLDKLLVKDGSTAHLYVAPHCVNTIREFGLYRRKRDPRQPDVMTDQPEDKNNHAMDSIRYALFTYFGSPEVVRNLTNLPQY